MLTYAGIPGNEAQVQQLGIKPKLSAELFLRPGQVLYY
jgi:hypothetical protein